MSAPELKPCPFCGGGAVLSADMARYPQCACDACGAYCGQTNEEGVEAAITAWNTRADLAPAAPKVKALVWQDFEGQGAKASGFCQANYLITLWRGRGQFEVSMSYPGYQTGFDGERWHDTLDQAKAAAQADYEARILAALEGGDA